MENAVSAVFGSVATENNKFKPNLLKTQVSLLSSEVCVDK